MSRSAGLGASQLQHQNSNEELGNGVAAAPKGGFKVKTEGTTMIRDYLSNVFDKGAAAKGGSGTKDSDKLTTGQTLDDKKQALLQKKSPYMLTKSIRSDEYSINEGGGEPESFSQPYQMVGEDEVDKERARLKKYIQKSIIEEELNSSSNNYGDNSAINNQNYKMLYYSKLKSISGGGLVQGDNMYRTESFQQNLDLTEFKKEQKNLKKKFKKLSTTQRLFNRKDLFMKKKKPENVNPVNAQQTKQK